METLLNNRKMKYIIFILLAVLTLLFIAKFVNEVKSSSYVGRGNQPANVISVNGTGDVMAVSDIATLTINLSKDGATAKEAQDLLNTSITSALAYLKDQKVEDKDIKSEYGGISPKYASQPICYTYSCPNSNPKIIGYTATQSITVKVREIDNASTIRTGLAGLEITDINGPTFSIDNVESLNDQARSIAITDAKTKADVLAKELGVKLGKVVNFSDNSGNNYPMYSSKALDMGVGAVSSSAPAPVLPTGENKITSNVSITYEIR